MKLVIINKQHKFEYKGKKVSFPKMLLALLAIMKDRVNHKWDNIILITGAVGTSKSTLAQGIVGIWEKMFNRELSIENFTWSAAGVTNFVEQDNNETEGIIYDEAIKGGTGRDVLTKEGNMLKVSLVVGRRKRHLYIMIVDELQEFNKKIISRANLLIDMRTLLVKGRETRGYFKLYSNKQLKQIYWLLKEQKIKNISHYSPYQEPFYQFANVEGKFIDNEEYENKKIEETKQSIQKDKIVWKPEKVIAYGEWQKGTKQKDIAHILNVSITTINNWVSEFKKIQQQLT